ncbi:MAG: exopolysaccharide biosynthesis polyprenyl glycosylphosphotransferase [Candidatus Korobacteraceae bacterium]
MKIGGQRIPGKTLVLIASEAALLSFGLIVATALRFNNIDNFRQAISQPGALLRYAIVVLVCELALYYYDLYDLQVVTRRSVLFVRLLQALGSACLILAFLYYWYPDLSLGRGVAALAAPLIIVAVAGWRLVVDASAPLLRRKERILIVGDGPAGSSLAAEVLRRPELNIEIIGFLYEANSAPRGARASSDRDYQTSLAAAPMHYSLRYGEPATGRGSGALVFAGSAEGVFSGAATAFAKEPIAINAVAPRILGTTADVERFAVSERADRVVLSLSERRGGTPISQLLRLKFVGIKIEEAHDMYERTTGRILLDHLSPSWLFLADGFRQPRLVLATKRAIDIAISTVALILTLPLMAIVALAVFVESGSPVLFRQQRIGLNGRTFEMLKFRSMKQSTTKGASWTSDQDPRITRVGRFIRKFRLDELPQLINVLRGDMSLVGPRPEQPTLADLLEEQIPYYGQRHSLRPGITGWAQVKYGYGGTVGENKVKLEHDLFYIKHLSMPLDLAIIFETGKVLLSGRGAK